VLSEREVSQEHFKYPCRGLIGRLRSLDEFFPFCGSLKAMSLGQVGQGSAEYAKAPVPMFAYIGLREWHDERRKRE
jgi:hypothetical protein